MSLTIPFVRRTLDRMRQVTLIEPKEIATSAALGVSLAEIVDLEIWARKVSAFLMTAQPLCAECGKPVHMTVTGPKEVEVNRKRPDARHCSNRCRQRA